MYFPRARRAGAMRGSLQLISKAIVTTAVYLGIVVDLLGVLNYSELSIGKITFVKPGPLLSVCLSVPGVHSKNLVLMMPKVVSRPEFTQDHESGLRSDRRPPLRTSSSM